MLCTKYTDLVLSHGRRPIRCTPDKCHLSLLRLECGIQRGMGIATDGMEGGGIQVMWGQW